MKVRSQEPRKTVLPMQRLKIADAEEDGRRRFEGYAAVFGNRDAHGDIIVKGAFERTLRERPEVKVLWQHNTDEPIGVMEDGYEDDYGLAVRGILSAIPLVKDTVIPLMLDKVVTGLSIGYGVQEEEHTADGWLLKDIDLHEFSPVTFPANELAQIASVKTLDSRGDMHVATVERHAKTLIHELGGYFADDSDRRDGLDFDLLKELRAKLAGTLPGADLDEDAAAHAELDLELAMLEGVELGIGLTAKGCKCLRS